MEKRFRFHTVLPRFLARVSCMVVLICLLLCGLTGCQKEIPDEVQKFYIDYLEAFRGGFTEEVIEYLYYEDSSVLEMDLNSGTIVTDYENLQWERLSDKLWAVSLTVYTNEDPQGQPGVNFVGVIDGQYYVIRNVSMIPQELRKGANIDPYLE